MAKLTNLFSIILLFSLISYSLAKKQSAAATTARKSDIPFIKCQVCERIAQQIHNQVSKKGSEISPKKVSEYQIIEIAENLCNLKKEEADWILQIDIVENGDKLELVDQGTEGLCNSECKTIERACQEIMGYSDTDVAEYIYKNQPSVDKLKKYLCKDLSNACSVKTPPVPKDRKPGEPFAAKPSKDAEMDKILRSMEGMPGAPNMKMYSRDELMNKNKFGTGEEADDDDEDDDDDDDEDNFPGKLGNILREKESPKKDFKHQILKGVQDAKAVVRQHVTTVSKQIKSWWGGKKASKKTNKKTNGKNPKKGKSEL